MTDFARPVGADVAFRPASKPGTPIPRSPEYPTWTNRRRVIRAPGSGMSGIPSGHRAPSDERRPGRSLTFVGTPSKPFPLAWCPGADAGSGRRLRSSCPGDEGLDLFEEAGEIDGLGVVVV